MFGRLGSSAGYRVVVVACALLGVYGCASTSSQRTLSNPVATSQAPQAAPLVETPEGLRRISPNGVQSPAVEVTSATETVSYYNPNTGTSAEYDLEVDRNSDGEVVRLNFPSQGWIEIHGEAIENADGTSTYTRDDGAEYTFTTRPEGASDRADETDDSDSDSE